MLRADEVLWETGVAWKAAAPPMAVRVIAAESFMVYTGRDPKDLCQRCLTRMWNCGKEDTIPRNRAGGETEKCRQVRFKISIERRARDVHRIGFASKLFHSFMNECFVLLSDGIASRQCSFGWSRSQNWQEQD
jgi:hypothetical protein